MPPSSSTVTGNPVFDYKAGFRRTAQSAQRILFLSGILLLIAGVAGRIVAPANPEMRLALRYAPLLGVALVGLCGIWGFWWRNKLRADFQREYSNK